MTVVLAEEELPGVPLPPRVSTSDQSAKFFCAHYLAFLPLILKCLLRGFILTSVVGERHKSLMGKLMLSPVVFVVM